MPDDSVIIPSTKASENQLLLNNIKSWSKALGFQKTGFTDIDLTNYEPYFIDWLQKGYQGSMKYMSRHDKLRTHPNKLVENTQTIISVRMDYFPPDTQDEWQTLKDSQKGYISRYALGRDYHKLMRKRLQLLAQKIESHIGSFGYRVFVDSAPVLEKPLAEKAGLGWIGKHSNVIHENAGSWFFLGEIYTDLPLPIDTPSKSHCGNCKSCIEICPTQAIIAPEKLDARRCISYLTIEHREDIPEEFRPLIGNRIYGCDDCQLICPWNRFAQRSSLPDFAIRHELDNPELINLFTWDESSFLDRMAGSAIRRIGHARWLRNIAVALGNATTEPDIIIALKSRKNHASAMVRNHVEWALKQHTGTN